MVLNTEDGQGDKVVKGGQGAILTASLVCAN
jgi:hypothetical protein